MSRNTKYSFVSGLRSPHPPPPTPPARVTICHIDLCRLRDAGESKRSIGRQPKGQSSEGTRSGAQARGHSVAIPQLRRSGGSCRLVLALPDNV